MNKNRVLIIAILFLIFIIVFARLTGFIVEFGLQSLQMDLSSNYTAGESLNNGLSPYKNNIVTNPPIWDGIANFKHSRFLYPPLMAVSFRLLTLMPYLFAKFFWMFFSLLSIILVLVVVGKTIGLSWRIESILIMGIFLCLFYPLLTLLERGQVDTLTLLIIVIAINWMLRGKKNQFFSGILLAIATLIKLHCIFIIPFIVLRRKYRVIVGYVIGGFLIIILSILLAGPTLFYDYVFNQLPRISKFAECGNQEMVLSKDLMQRQINSLIERFPPDTIQRYFTDTTVPLTIKQAVIYKYQSFNFISNATLVRALFMMKLFTLFNHLGIKDNISIFSFIIFAVFFIFMMFWQLYQRKIFSNFKLIQEAIYWQIVLIIVLLASPLTWVMSEVWLLPIAVLILYKYPLIKNRSQKIIIYLSIMLLILTALPDSFMFILGSFREDRYVFAEIGLFLLLLGMLNHKRQADSQSP